MYIYKVSKSLYNSFEIKHAKVCLILSKLEVDVTCMAILLS